MRRAGDAAFGLLVLVSLLSLLLPFAVVVSTSLKAPGELLQRAQDGEMPSLLPRSLFIDTIALRVRGPSSTARAAQRTLRDRLEALRAETRVDHWSAVIGETGEGEVSVSYDRRLVGPADVQRLVTDAGLSFTQPEPPRPWPVLTSYVRVFTQNPFHLYLLNSAVVATLTTLLCLLVGGTCAYALARLRFPMRDAVLSLLLAVSMFPPIAVVSPLFLILKKAHLLNTHAALVIPYTAFGLPLTVWTLTGFFRDLPLELEEAARVDGCSRLRTFVEIFLPLAGPGVFTCAILVFIFAWNEFLFALLFVTRDAMRTVTVGITMYPGQFDTPWGTIFAAATIVTLPLIGVVFALQRRIIEGLTAGAVKG